MSNPDHALPHNWRPSIAANGTPGTNSPVTTFTGTPDEDLDLSAFVEYALGTDDNTFDSSPLALNGGTLSFSRSLAAHDLRLIVETSTDLVTCQSNSTLTEHWTIPSGPRIFIHIRIDLIP
ncbi:MAG: hypothetical protein QNK82_11825 [Akkermansiaceae bacterium]|jgi:hypothetical protein